MTNLINDPRAAITDNAQQTEPAARIVEQSSRPLPLPLWRVLFIFSVLWGSLIFWLAPHPPMVDLPQHAAQVTLLRDMLLGQSPWSDLFRINPFTPYILGYGLALPLSFVMPIAAALKLLLSIAYIAFVFMCVKLRQHFGADSRLDWLFILSFFGLAYKFGFLTFLVAAPIGLWFMLLADRYAQAPTALKAAGLTAVGLLLLTSHGLVFLFAVSIGGLFLLAAMRNIKSTLTLTTPYLILLLVFVVYLLANLRVNTGMPLQTNSALISLEGPSRLAKMLVYTVASNTRHFSDYPLLLAVSGMLVLPWLLGLRVTWQRKATWIPFAILVVICLFVPAVTLATSYIYQRFALFVLPAYAWMFTRRVAPFGKLGAVGEKFALPVLVIVCWSMLGLHTVRVWRFGNEARDFDYVLHSIEPRQRALALVFDQNSKADNSHFVYRQYPSWYQAERGGLVDFNFAWYPPQIVRYRPDRLPGVKIGFDVHPEIFDWNRNRGRDYRYFFVRHGRTMPDALFQKADCEVVPVVSQGTWTIFERRGCTEMY
jgi:hypothetical protein